MTPIERIRAKAKALEVLGLGHYATQDEIREAWKRIAFDTHPDRNSSGHADFASAKAAYDMLRGVTAPEPGNGPVQPTATAPARGCRTSFAKRPTVATRRLALTPDASAACAALLKGGEAGDAKVVELVTNEIDGQDHVPEAVHRCGRSLTYIVRAPLAEGRNRVAVPTGVLEGARKVKPMIVTFEACAAGPAKMPVPDELRATAFPGARSVDIRFTA